MQQGIKASASMLGCHVYMKFKHLIQICKKHELELLSDFFTYSKEILHLDDPVEQEVIAKDKEFSMHQFLQAFIP